IWGVLGFLILPGLTMFVCWSLWKVEVRRDSFTYRNFMGITKTYYYADLEWDIAHTGLKWWFFKDGKKVFCMAYFIEDENKLRRIYNKYKQKHRNKDQLNNQN
ncbi:MAG: hypothetical protein IJ996_02520, partial [Clostridia bacterium]|nr:hypothetical protein [Clostridia bacterium]